MSFIFYERYRLMSVTTLREDGILFGIIHYNNFWQYATAYLQPPLYNGQRRILHVLVVPMLGLVDIHDHVQFYHRARFMENQYSVFEVFRSTSENCLER